MLVAWIPCVHQQFSNFYKLYHRTAEEKFKEPSSKRQSSSDRKLAAFEKTFLYHPLPARNTHTHTPWFCRSFKSAIQREAQQVASQCMKQVQPKSQGWLFSAPSPSQQKAEKPLRAGCGKKLCCNPAGGSSSQLCPAPASSWEQRLFRIPQLCQVAPGRDTGRAKAWLRLPRGPKTRKCEPARLPPRQRKGPARASPGRRSASPARRERKRRQRRRLPGKGRAVPPPGCTGRGAGEARGRRAGTRNPPTGDPRLARLPWPPGATPVAAVAGAAPTSPVGPFGT